MIEKEAKGFICPFLKESCQGEKCMMWRHSRFKPELGDCVLKYGLFVK